MNITSSKAVLFDLDGVLIDATEWHYEALNEALGLFGYSIGRDDHIKVYNGLPTKEKLKIMSNKNNMPLALHSVIRTQKKLYTQKQIDKNCKPDYSKILMLSWLKSKGMKLACCSNATQESVEYMLEKSMLKGYFDEIIGNDVGFSPKPAPDIYLEAMKRLDLKPEECIIVEDAPHGIEAAKSSGGKVIEVSGYSDVNLNLFNC
jgi:HAD superfamily hydrolase (TIGR01509 family)